MALLFPVLSFICGLILANNRFSSTLKPILSTCLARLLIPIVIIYNMVFYQSGSIVLILFSFLACFVLYFISALVFKDHLIALSNSYTNMAWLGFPIAIAIFGAEKSMAMIPLYIGVSIFGNSWAVVSVSQGTLSKLELCKKIFKSPPVVALIIAAILRGIGIQHLQNHLWIDAIYFVAKWGMSFAGMCVLGMWLRSTRIHIDDLKVSLRFSVVKMITGLILCGLSYVLFPIPYLQASIGIIFLLFCLPPAANIVALETYYRGTGESARYIATGTIVSCVICVIYGVCIHLLF